jgi:hypothetical protein
MSCPQVGEYNGYKQTNLSFVLSSSLVTSSACSLRRLDVSRVMAFAADKDDDLQANTFMALSLLKIMPGSFECISRRVIPHRVSVVRLVANIQVIFCEQGLLQTQESHRRW